MSKKRYKRLNAISDFGYDVKWELLHEKSAVIVGVGGLGILAADMLARCGIGTLYLFDKDIINEVNLNRIGFMESDIGSPKVEVVAKNINLINTDVKVITCNGDIMNFGIDEKFDQAVQKCDVVLMGVDNYPARTFVNQKCIKHNKVLIDAGVSRSALSGYIHPIFPGKNACMQCMARIQGTNELKERSATCIASLPTTFAIIAGLQVQETLKYFFDLGEMVDYLSYNALTGEFNKYKTQRDDKCSICGNLKDK
jgi:ubiquitin-like modifier-activating enzyme 5